MITRTNQINIHLPTIVAIAIVSWVAVTIIHEIIGHGVVCLLVGGDPLAVSTTELYCGDVAGRQYKLVAAAGSLANIIAGLFGFALSRVATRSSSTLSYFLWLFSSTNIFHAGSYMMIGPFTGYGDWSYVIQGFEPVLLWKIGMTALGYAICILGTRLAALPQWQLLIGQDPDERRTRMQLLTRVPFVTALIVNILAGLFSPLQLRWALTTSLLAPMVLLWLVNLPAWPRSEHPISGVSLPSSIAWLIVGILGFILFVGVLGPGVGSFSGHILERH